MAISQTVAALTNSSLAGSVIAAFAVEVSK
jgi:hypothetical protein